MKLTDTEEKDHNLEFLVTMSNHLGGCCAKDLNSPDRKEEVKKIVDNINEFYAEYGRMPKGKEMDAVLSVDESAEKELTYEIDDPSSMNY